jgi:hypothetical protein
VRIIEAGLDVHGAGGTRLGDGCRLITTLLDWRRYPAGELARLYHERREIEVACLALRHTLPGGYVLRSRDRAGARDGPGGGGHGHAQRLADGQQRPQFLLGAGPVAGPEHVSAEQGVAQREAGDLDFPSLMVPRPGSGASRSAW